MKELGFNPNGSTSAQEAFIRNLMKSAYGVSVITPSEKKEIQSSPEKIKSFQKNGGFQQMSFEFEDAQTPPKASKKSG